LVVFPTYFETAWSRTLIAAPSVKLSLHKPKDVIAALREEKKKLKKLFSLPD
jgi:hypothetical protein